MKLQQPVMRSLLPQLLKESETAMEHHNYQRAIDILQRAERLAPHDPVILLDLGRSHGMLYDYAAAERFFEKAIRVSGWKPASFLAAGLHCQAFSRHEMAGHYFERTLRKNGASTEALVQLATICERQNRLEEAADYVDRTLSLDGTCAAALLLKAKLERHGGQLEAAEKILRLLVGKPNPDTWTHAHSWYELGGVLDRQRRYDEAMAAFLEAKALMQPTAEMRKAELQKSQERVKKNAELISAEVLQRWFNAGSELTPPYHLAVLCGHPRSGTTLLEQVLDAHPGIVSAEETMIFQNVAYNPLTRGFPPETVSLLPVLET
ncbi:MAG TPA: tetratricopeptide repeat protein, partial [Verrucomicrobiae bacterium]|nr:tetratricopeptide repeat protein [Verrucomicrobiae bacterium]